MNQETLDSGTAQSKNTVLKQLDANEYAFNEHHMQSSSLETNLMFASKSRHGYEESAYCYGLTSNVSADQLTEESYDQEVATAVMHQRAKTADSFGEIPVNPLERSSQVQILSEYYNMLPEETQNFGEGIVHQSVIYDERDGFDRRSIQCSEADEPEPQAVPQQYVRTGYTQSPRRLYESFHVTQEPAITQELPGEEKCEMVVWGSNHRGQLGLGDRLIGEIIRFPINLQFSQDVVKISCGQDHTALVTSSRMLFVMGNNMYGQLGIGHQYPETEQDPARRSVSVKHCSQPALVDALAHMRVVDVACGGKHTVAVVHDIQTGHAVFAWGDNSKSQLGIPGQNLGCPQKLSFSARTENCAYTVDRVAAGHEHTVFLDSTNHIVLACGESRFGQLGINRQTSPVSSPTVVDSLNDKNVIGIAAGRNHTLALTHEGTVFASGLNSSGQLGMGHQETLQMFMMVPKLKNVTEISAGSYSGAIDNQGNLLVWGFWGTSHSLIPKLIRPQEQTQFTTLSIGDGFGVALDVRGKIYGWGSNEVGQLGYSFSKNSDEEICEVQVMSDKGIVQDVVTGQNFVIAKMAEIFDNHQDNEKAYQLNELLKAQKSGTRLVSHESRNGGVCHTETTDHDSISPDFKQLENKSSSHPILTVPGSSVATKQFQPNLSREGQLSPRYIAHQPSIATTTSQYTQHAWNPNHIQETTIPEFNPTQQVREYQRYEHSSSAVDRKFDFSNGLKMRNQDTRQEVSKVTLQSDQTIRPYQPQEARIWDSFGDIREAQLPPYPASPRYREPPFHNHASLRQIIGARAKSQAGRTHEAILIQDPPSRDQQRTTNEVKPVHSRRPSSIDQSYLNRQAKENVTRIDPSRFHTGQVERFDKGPVVQVHRLDQQPVQHRKRSSMDRSKESRHIEKQETKDHKRKQKELQAKFERMQADYFENKKRREKELQTAYMKSYKNLALSTEVNLNERSMMQKKENAVNRSFPADRPRFEQTYSQHIPVFRQTYEHLVKPINEPELRSKSAPKPHKYRPEHRQPLPQLHPVQPQQTVSSSVFRTPGQDQIFVVRSTPIGYNLDTSESIQTTEISMPVSTARPTPKEWEEPRKSYDHVYAQKLRKKYKKLKLDNRAKTSKLNEQASEIEHLKTIIQELKNEVSTRKFAWQKRLKEREDRHNAETRTIRAELAVLKEQVLTTERLMSQKDLEVKQSNQRANDSQIQIQQAESELRSLREQLKRFSNQHDQLKHANEGLVKKDMEKDHHLRELRQHMDMRNMCIHEAESTIKEQTKAIRKMESFLKDQQAETETKNESIKEYANQVEQLFEERGNCYRQIELLKNQVDSLKGFIKELENNNQELTKLLNAQNDKAVDQYKAKLQTILAKSRDGTTPHSNYESLGQTLVTSLQKHKLNETGNLNSRGINSKSFSPTRSMDFVQGQLAQKRPQAEAPRRSYQKLEPPQKLTVTNFDTIGQDERSFIPTETLKTTQNQWAEFASVKSDRSLEHQAEQLKRETANISEKAGQMLDKLQLINRKLGNRPLTNEPNHDAGRAMTDYSTADLNRLALRHGMMSSPANPYMAYNNLPTRSKSTEEQETASRKTYETHDSSAIGIGIAPHYNLLRAEPDVSQSQTPQNNPNIFRQKARPIMSYQQSKRDNVSENSAEINFRQVSKQLMRQHMEEHRVYY